MVWPTADIPTYGRGVWLECNGQSFSRTQFPQLYETLGTTRVPDYRGMFLRGYGSQSYSQDNGERNSSSTTYTSGNIGKIQGDAVRENIWATEPMMVYQSDKRSYYEPISHHSSLTESRKFPSWYYDNNSVAYARLDGENESTSGTLFIPKPTFHTITPAWYRYEMSCTSSGENEESTTCELIEKIEEYGELATGYSEKDAPYLRGTDYWNKSFLTHIGYDNKLDSPVDNEIRPVNIAVKFMIKAK